MWVMVWRMSSSMLLSQLTGVSGKTRQLMHIRPWKGLALRPQSAHVKSEINEHGAACTRPAPGLHLARTWPTP